MNLLIAFPDLETLTDLLPSVTNVFEMRLLNVWTNCTACPPADSDSC